MKTDDFKKRLAMFGNSGNKDNGNSKSPIKNIDINNIIIKQDKKKNENNEKKKFK